MQYPQAQRLDVTEVVHGTPVADPYRWLEDTALPATQEWISAQNALSADYLQALPERAWFASEMAHVVARPRFGTPYRKGGRYFVSRGEGAQEHDVWCVAKNLDKLLAGGRVLVDPHELSPDGSIALGRSSASEDGRYFAYSTQRNGSDWLTIRVIDIDASKELDDRLEQSRYCVAAWLPDNTSFIYLHFDDQANDSPDPTPILKQHRVGTPQSEDVAVLTLSARPFLLPYAEVSYDGRWLIVELREGTSDHNRLWVLPITTHDDGCTIGEPVRMFDEPDAHYDSIRVVDDRMLVLTNKSAPNYRLVSAPIVDSTTDLRDVIAEQDAVLESVTSAGGSLVTVHLDQAVPVLHRYSLDGTEHNTIPIFGESVVALNGSSDDDELFVGVVSPSVPLRNYRVDLSTFDVVKLPPIVRFVRGKRPAHWRAPDVEIERFTAQSDDGTAVPYVVVYAAGTDLSDPRPLLLSGYGGFNVATATAFRPGWPAWIAAGGVLAVAHLRGEGAFGTRWRVDGVRRRKPNAFKDFIAVAEDLIAQGFTTSAQMCSMGRSSGGLVVAATLTQRPDLFAAAVPVVGMLDMLRFHRFPVGHAWLPEFGDPEDAEDFAHLLAYSPLHQITPGTSYPPTLIVTGEHDDRVVPAHSFKFAATLQHAQSGHNPVLVRIDERGGHGTGTPTAELAAEWTDMLAFAAHHTGLQPR